MPDSETVLSDFMADKNKEALGESAPKPEGEDDNYLADDKLILSGFTDEAIPKDEKALLAFTRIMRIALMVPLLVGTIFIVLYFIIKVGPSLLMFIRNLFVSLSKA
ncbi:MAG: hypothetical protein LBP39_00435 [Rickettsiales bacterium]|jgi:hypothetical protein|nr:hypothetical protein [Rickettsiales bacterium]